MNNLFQRFCSVRSFCCRGSIFSYLRRAVFILSQANFYSIHFLKVRHFPGKIDNKPLPGVFLEAALPLQQTFKKVLRPIFIWRGTGREFVARLAASRPKKLAPLAKKLVKLDFAVVSMGFSEALSSFSHFSSLYQKPLSLSANFEAHTLQNDFDVFFRLGVKDENGQALFSSLEEFTSKLQGKTVSTILVDHDFCQIS